MTDPDLIARLAELEEENALLQQAIADYIEADAAQLAERHRLAQRALYQAHLMEIIHDAVISTDAEFRVRSWNRAATELYGWPEHEVLGVQVNDLLRTEPVQGDMAAVWAAFSEEGYYKGEFIQRRRDGSEVIVNGSISMMHDDHGEMFGAVAVNRNITEQKKMIEELKQNEGLFRAVTENVPTAIFVAEIELGGRFEPTVVYMNAATERLTGYTREELFRMQVSELIPLAHYVEIATIIKHGTHMPGEVHRDYLLEIMRKDGAERWLEVSIMHIFFNGTPAYLGVANDVTERSETRERDRRLQEASARLGTTLDFDELLTVILEAGEHLLQAECSSIMLVDGRRIFMAELHGFPQLTPYDLMPEPALLSDIPLLDDMVHERDVLILDDMMAEEQYTDHDDITARIGLHAYIGVPITVRGEVMGVLNLFHRTPGYFHMGMRDSLLSYIRQVALALTNADRYRKSKELAKLEERNRLARELHDSVTQTMHSARMIAKMLPTSFASDDVTGFKQLDLLQDTLDAALKEMRALLFELRPDSITDTPLDHLAEQTLDVFRNRTRLDVQADIDGPLLLPDVVQNSFYRVLQESLSNIIRHSQATQVIVSLKSEGNLVTLRVKDNGVGFRASQIKSGRFGLKGMHERAEEMHGHLDVISRKDEGTEVILSWADLLEVDDE